MGMGVRLVNSSARSGAAGAYFTRPYCTVNASERLP